MSNADAETLSRLLERRRSCRAFERRAVPRATIERLLKMAQRTASWSNTQPWQVIVTEGVATDRFREAATNWAGSASESWDFTSPVEYTETLRERRRATARQLYESVGIEWGDREGSAGQALENFRLFNAPHVALVHVPTGYGAYGAVDAGGYIANFLLAAEALHLGAVAQAALAAYSAEVRGHFGIPDGRSFVAGIAFGYADVSHPTARYRTPRADVPEIVTWHDS